MSEFANYTPGEYAKEHIRITPTTLADGRAFFYLDDDPEYVSGAKMRELNDPRQLAYRFSNQLNAAGEEVPYAAPEMRRDPLTGDWIPMATARMNRPITAGPGATAKGNPLAARKPGDPYQDGEVPDTDYNVVVFENRFPSMVRVPGRSEAVEYVNGNPKTVCRQTCRSPVCAPSWKHGRSVPPKSPRWKASNRSSRSKTTDRKSASPWHTLTDRSTATRSSRRRWKPNSSRPKPTMRRPAATCSRIS